ncbi:MAG: EpsG family protein [Oscillospiraceae bacterium]|jgi:hypothetical protein|nr:EpsG family protein [Oscillospiraceae bacterium]
MAVYISLLCAVIFPSFFVNINENDKRKKKYLVFAFSLIALAAALRSIGVGVDTRQFCNAYIEIGRLSWTQMYSLRYEPGFITLSKLLNYISGSHQLLLIASGCFIAFSYGRFIYKNSDNVVTGTIVFYCMFFAQSMNLMRQYLAVGVLLFGLEFIKQKKHVKFLLFVLLAVSFHYSAVVCVIYIVLYKLVIKKGLFLALSAVLVLILLNFRRVLTLITQLEALGQYTRYIGGRFDMSDSTRPIKIVLALLILIFLVINAKRQSESEDINHNFIINMLLTWAAVEALATSSYIFTRSAPYFDFVATIAVAKALVSIKETKLRVMFTLIVYAMMIAYFIISRILNISQVMPYMFFWEV